MACACQKEGKPRCAWCNEAIKNQLSQHNCSSYGTCD